MKIKTKISLVFFVVAYIPLFIADLIWILVSLNKIGNESASVKGRFTVFFLILIFGSLILILLSRWFGKYATRPVEQLGENVKKIIERDLDFKLNFEAGNEAGKILDAFRMIISQLNDSRLNFKRKIEERTRELKAQRDQLEKTTKDVLQRDIFLSEAREQQEKNLREAVKAKEKAEIARLATLNILEDVEEAREAQDIEKNKLDSIFSSLTDGLILLDQFGFISLMNIGAEVLLGLKKKDAFMRRLNELENVNAKEVFRVLEAAQGAAEEEIKLEGTGEKIIRIGVVPVIGPEKNNLGQLIILYDITREKVIEKMKSEFVTIAAHQLRTPLSAVKWTLRLILDQDVGPISQEQAEMLQKGYQSNERMIALVNDLLNAARIEEGRFVFSFSKIAFDDLVKEVVAGFETASKMRKTKINFEKSAGKDFNIEVDQEKIKLAVQNLIENAINYSPPGSVVTIGLDCDKMNLQFLIKDTGMGIPKSQHNRIFSKFFRGDNAVKMETEGTGLGLFLTKNIIEAHGGKIWFESEENKGSVFYFTLPLNRSN